MTTALGLDLDYSMEITIGAPPDAVLDAIVKDVNTWFVNPENGETMGFELEARPGGRFFRDLGNDAGHLWGFVQVFKPGSLLELIGPMWFESPVQNFIRFKVEEHAGATRLSFIHRAVGPIDDDTKGRIQQGWTHLLNDQLKNHIEG